MSDGLRAILGRAAYAAVLFVIAFSALEQFAQLNEELIGLSPRAFHGLAGTLALVAALFEATTLRGIDGVRGLFERPDPIGPILQHGIRCRVATSDDLVAVRRLALKRYGWAFPMRALKRWHRCNPNCLFLMLAEGRLVGYLDAFPIAEVDYQFLLRGGKERRITPLGEQAVSPTTSFYIASVVLDEGAGAKLAVFLKRAVSFYARSYPNKSWQRLCAIGYSQAGRRLLEHKEMRRLPEDVKASMYTLERARLPHLSRCNRAFWEPLLPDSVLEPTAGIEPATC